MLGAETPRMALAQHCHITTGLTRACNNVTHRQSKIRTGKLPSHFGALCSEIGIILEFSATLMAVLQIFL